MLAITQILVVAACAAGLFVFIFVNWFTFRRLQHEHRRVLEDKIERPIDRVQLVYAEEDSRLSIEAMEREKEMALFYMHQEQVRRLLDAKIDVIRNTAETHNRIALVQAEVVKLAAEKEVRLAENGMIDGEISRPMTIEHHPIMDVAEDGSASLVVGDPCNLPVAANAAGPTSQVGQLLGTLSQQQQAMRSETERQLELIDSQMHSLPGKSMAGWVESQRNSQRD